MNVQAKYLTPSPKYLVKLRVQLSLIAFLILLGGLVLGILIGLEEGFGAIVLTLAITLFADLLWWIPGMFLTGPYYESLRYEVHEEEMIVNAGVITKSVKHVPFRTVTNLTIKRGILDRWFNIGTLDIQTAGMSGSTGEPEQSLVGLEDAQAVYETVVTALHRFRSGMTPTNAEMEEPKPASADTLDAILAEVRAIRQALARDA